MIQPSYKRKKKNKNNKNNRNKDNNKHQLNYNKKNRIIQQLINVYLLITNRNGNLKNNNNNTQKCYAPRVEN